MAAATTAVNGYLTSTDWNTFNSKQAALSTGATINGIVYPANGAQTLQIPLAPAAATDAVNKQYVDSFGQWGTSAGHVYRTTGNVGIGTASPTAKLDVVGNAKISGNVTIGDPTAYYNGLTINSLYGNGGTGFTIDFFSKPFLGSYTGAVALASNSGNNEIYRNAVASTKLELNASGMQLLTAPTGTTGAAIAWSEAFRVNQNGNVGIGTTAPGSTLDVKGTLRLSGSTSGYVGFAPAAAAGATTYTLPTTQGTSGQVLSTNGVATTPTLSWVSVTSGTVTSVTSANADIAVETTTSTPVLTLNSGTGANQIVKLNGTSQLPAVDGSLLTSLNPANLSAAVSVAKGGTGLTAGVSGGIPYFNTTTTMASSALLGLNGIMLGGGAGAAPTTLGTGVAGQFLKSAGASAPAWANLAIGDLKSSVAGNLFPGSSCGAAQTLVYSIVTDSFTCTNLPASATYWSAATGGINYASGNVGIGTTTPAQKLSLGMTDVIASQKLLFDVAGTDVGFIESERHTAAGRLSDLHFGTMGSRRMTIDDSGNVGIGTSVPSTKFEVSSGSSSVDSTLRVSVPSVATADPRISLWAGTIKEFLLGVKTSDGSFRIDEGGAALGTNSRFTIAAGGNVGIGTTTPTKKLDVSGIIKAGSASAVAGSTILVDNYTSGNLSTFGTEQSSGAPVLGYGVFPSSSIGTFLSSTPIALNRAAITVGSTDGIRFYQGAMQTVATNSAVTLSEVMRITQQGNVGIGTTTPTSTLDVNGNVGTGARITSLVDGANNAFWLAKGSSAEANRIGYGINADPVTGVVGSLGMRTNGVARLTIDNAGRVGLGTESPGSIFHLANGAPYITYEETDTTQKIFTGVDGSGYWIRQGSTANADLLTVRPTGNIGIGTSTPGYKLDVQGGNVNSAGAYTNVSDRRLKQDIRPLKNSLEKIMQLEGVNYYWRDQSFDSSKQVGFIAQEVEKIFPEVVKTDSRGFKAMSYSQLVSPVVSAIKELFHKWFDDSRSIHREMASIKAENTKLKQENEAIKNYLCDKDPKAAICQ